MTHHGARIPPIITVSTHPPSSAIQLGCWSGKLTESYITPSTPVSSCSRREPTRCPNPAFRCVLVNFNGDRPRGDARTPTVDLGSRSLVVEVDDANARVLDAVGEYHQLHQQFGEGLRVVLARGPRVEGLQELDRRERGDDAVGGEELLRLDLAFGVALLAPHAAEDARRPGAQLLALRFGIAIRVHTKTREVVLHVFLPALDDDRLDDARTARVVP